MTSAGACGCDRQRALPVHTRHTHRPSHNHTQLRYVKLRLQTVDVQHTLRRTEVRQGCHVAVTSTYNQSVVVLLLLIFKHHQHVVRSDFALQQLVLQLSLLSFSQSSALVIGYLNSHTLTRHTCHQFSSCLYRQRHIHLHFGESSFRGFQKKLS